MKVTIESIAQTAGVSKSTVSRALNDNARISARVREQIKKTACQLGYFDNALNVVNSTRNEPPKNIGVSFININNPFSIEISKGILDACRINGYCAIIMDANMDPQVELNNIRNFQALGVKGMIIHGTTLDTHQRVAQIDTQTPKIFLGRRYRIGEASFVCVDTQEAFYKVTEYLIQLNHRRIAFVGASEKFFERVQGYRTAMNTYQIPFGEDDIKFCASTRLSGYNAMRELMNSGVNYTAIACVNDYVAIGVMEYIKTHGARVPEDFSVTGVDNLEISSYVGIDLTTVNQPCYEIGRTAVELLTEKIVHNDTAPNAYRLLESHFVIRKSCRALEAERNDGGFAEASVNHV